MARRTPPLFFYIFDGDLAGVGNGLPSYPHKESGIQGIPVDDIKNRPSEAEEKLFAKGDLDDPLPLHNKNINGRGGYKSIIVAEGVIPLFLEYHLQVDSQLP